jgi:hypothetical protein
MEDPMRNKKLVQYIDSLSAGEREKYRDLIDESLQRDTMLAQNVHAMNRYLEDFAADFNLLQEKALQLEKSLCALSETLMEMRDASQMISGICSRGPVWN